MNPWGLVVTAAGGVCVAIAAFGTQGKVWQMITGGTQLSTTQEAKQLSNLPSGALPVATKAPGTK